MLPPENQCYGCEKNCCDPVTVGTAIDLGEKRRVLPLNRDDPWQLPSVSDSDIDNLTTHFRIMAQKDIDNHPVSHISHFRLKGYSLVGLGPNGIAHAGNERSESYVVEATMAGTIPINVIYLAAVGVFDCTKFNNGICSIYDGERPYDPCVRFTTEDCGRSHLAKAWQKEKAIDGIRSIQKCMKPTMDEAIDDFILRMRRQYFAIEGLGL